MQLMPCKIKKCFHPKTIQFREDVQHLRVEPDAQLMHLFVSKSCVLLAHGCSLAMKKISKAEGNCSIVPTIISFGVQIITPQLQSVCRFCCVLSVARP